LTTHCRHRARQRLTQAHHDLAGPSQQDRGYLSILEFADDDTYAAYLASDAFRAAHTWPDHAPINSNRLTTYHVCTEITPAADGPQARSK